MTKKLLIADVEQEYIERLKNYINRKYPSDYVVETFCDKALLRERLQCEKCEIVLFSEEMYDAQFLFKNVKLPVLLVEESGQVLYPEKLKWTIAKYSRISSIIQYVETQYAEVERNRPLIYSFYSPAGGVGKTTAALGAALSYEQAGRKVLYVNLEDWDSTGLFLDGESKKVELSETLLAEEPLFRQLQDHLRCDQATGIMYWSRVANETDRALMNHLGEWIEKMIENGVVHIVILDLNQDYRFLKEKLVKWSDYIVLVSDGRTHSTYKMKQFLEETDSMNECRDKLRLVLNQGCEISTWLSAEEVSYIDTLSVSNAMNLCEVIAKNKWLKLHGLSE